MYHTNTRYLLLGTSHKFIHKFRLLNSQHNSGANYNVILKITGSNILSSFCLYDNTGIANGYPSFVVSICMIGVCTAVIGDIAGHLGCFIFLKDSVNAIAFVALGTSVPGILLKTLTNLPVVTTKIHIAQKLCHNSYPMFDFHLRNPTCPVVNTKHGQIQHGNMTRKLIIN